MNQCFILTVSTSVFKCWISRWWNEKNFSNSNIMLGLQHVATANSEGLQTLREDTKLLICHVGKCWFFMVVSWELNGILWDLPSGFMIRWFHWWLLDAPDSEVHTRFFSNHRCFYLTCVPKASRKSMHWIPPDPGIIGLSETTSRGSSFGSPADFSQVTFVKLCTYDVKCDVLTP